MARILIEPNLEWTKFLIQNFEICKVWKKAFISKVIIVILLLLLSLLLTVDQGINMKNCSPNVAKRKNLH